MAINKKICSDSGFKCKLCKICNGKACISELPGMGGVNRNENFIKNVADWNNYYNSLDDKEKSLLEKVDIQNKVGVAPVTGAVQNIGFKNEEDFYFPYFKLGLKKKYFICVGDGAPDEKLKFGLEAVKKLGIKAYFILKPYQNDVLAKRIDFVKDYASGIGIDIDAYNIVTMRNQVNLEKKSAEKIEELRNLVPEMPFIIKGVFTEEDVELCKNVKPEIAVVSNHGGRVETDSGSTCEFLAKNVKELKKCCNNIWVDGGIRSAQNIKTALYIGADKVLICRPLISQVCKSFLG